MHRFLKKIISLTLASILTLLPVNMNTAGAVVAQTKPSLPTFIDVAAGDDFSMALRSDGTVWCWGNNEYGQIGEGTEGDLDAYSIDNIVTKPFLVMGQVKSIAATYCNPYAITNSNELWIWGFNHSGRIGNGTANDCTLPIRLLTDVKMAASGKANHSVIIKNDGSLWTWGLNLDGQIGDLTKNGRYTPFNAMKDVKQAAAGEGHTMVVKTNGDLYVWGRNWKGQLGDGTKTGKMKPFKLMSNVKMAAAGSNQSFFITNDGSLYGCGVDVTGSFSKPKKIMTGVKDVSASYNYYIMTKTDGTLWAIGENQYGAFGDGTTKRKSTPVKIMDSVLKASAGGGHILVIKKDGTLWTSGLNDHGQLGLGDTKNRTTWVQVTDFPASGERATIGRLQNSMVLDGSLSGWKGIDPVATDPAGDALPGAADITALYAVKDEKYLYIAVKAAGTNPIVDISIDLNDDGESDYVALCYSSEKLAFLWGESVDQKEPGRVPTSYKQAVELKIPLAILGDTKDLQITAGVSHNKSFNVEGDVCKQYDVMGGWYRVN